MQIGQPVSQGRSRAHGPAPGAAQFRRSTGFAFFPGDSLFIRDFLGYMGILPCPSTRMSELSCKMPAKSDVGKAGARNGRKYGGVIDFNSRQIRDRKSVRPLLELQGCDIGWKS